MKSIKKNVTRRHSTSALRIVLLIATVVAMVTASWKPAVFGAKVSMSQFAMVYYHLQIAKQENLRDSAEAEAAEYKKIGISDATKVALNSQKQADEADAKISELSVSRERFKANADTTIRWASAQISVSRIIAGIVSLATVIVAWWFILSKILRQVIMTEEVILAVMLKVTSHIFGRASKGCNYAARAVCHDSKELRAEHQRKKMRLVKERKVG